MSATLWTLLRVLRERSAQERSCRWPPARLQAHQAICVAQLRQFALARSPFYREFHRGYEQRPFEDLPILTKPLMMERFDDVVTDRRLHLNEVETFLRRGEQNQLFRDRYVVLATSGSTGRRGVFLFDPREWIRVLASITRPISWSLERPGIRHRPRGALIAATAPWHYSARVSRELLTRAAPTLLLDAASPVTELVKKLNEWQPDTLGTYPSVLRELAVEQIAGRLRLTLRSAATSAEVLSADTRACVKRAWNINVQDTYGATEYSPIATECEYGRKHLFEDGALIEVVDDAGQAVPPGQFGSRLLLTVFGRFTQPLIRYEISDRVRLTGERCSCGRPYRTLDAIEGRQEDVLYFEAESRGDGTAVRAGQRAAGLGGASGRNRVAIHPNSFHDALEPFAVTAWQVVQDEAKLTVRLIGDTHADQLEQVENAVRAMLAQAGARAPAVIVKTVERLQRGATGKAPLIIASVPRAR